ncbi:MULTISPECIES: ABC transporter substrate-binding protein [Peribacillus]|uniref:ABC transporter substrate-binding protein n=1 Tax=Peribacillus frigoritolerans TaxID=450367 RepID=UPI003DA05EEF
MKKLFRVLLLVTFATILAACNQSQMDGTTPDGQTSNENEPVTIKHVLGNTELHAKPKKIVVLEWTYVEDLLALDIQPVGVTDIEGYNKWVQIDEELSTDVTDVGTRQEPNLEAIAQLEPDLIITTKFRHEGIKKELESIAPTIFFEPYPQDESISQYDEMVTTFKTIAKAVQKEDQADAILNELNEKYKETKEKIQAEKLKTNQFVLTQAYSSNQVPVLRVFTPNSMASVILEKVGLQNAYQNENFEVYGFSTVNVEALPALEEANFIYVVQDNDNIFENQLKDNDVWKNIAFVKEDRTYSLGEDTWLFGGPLSAKVLVDQIENALVEE